MAVTLSETTARSYIQRRRLLSRLRFTPSQLVVASVTLANGCIIAAFILGLAHYGAMALLVIAFVLNSIPLVTLFFLQRTGFSTNADFSTYLARGRK